jgi:LysR family transcriptional activator of nhaA
VNDLNFQHLRYFWLTAREGSLTAAARRMRLSPSTMSAQIRSLEESLGKPLFERRGRRLVLTEHGQVVREYADDIFALSEELVDAVHAQSGPQHATRLRVGVSNNLPKWVAYRLLAPALNIPDFPVHLVCIEDHADRLVADLAIHHLDLVLADAPVRLASDVKAESELLGECSVLLMAAPQVAARFLVNFPASLEGAPVLLPDHNSAMRRLLEDWFERSGIRPQVVAECGDSALLKAFGQAGAGLFPVPSLVVDEVAAQYRVVQVGVLDGLQEQFYAITPGSRQPNQAVQVILDSGHQALTR